MINKLKTNRAWSVSLSSRVTHASLSSSHGSNLFHANASNRHHTLLMLTCRSQLEVKTPITISINSIQPTAASSTGRMRHKSKPQISPSWFAPPARERNDCMHSLLQSWIEYKSESKCRLYFLFKERAHEILGSNLLKRVEKLASRGHFYLLV